MRFAPRGSVCRLRRGPPGRRRRACPCPARGAAVHGTPALRERIRARLADSAAAQIAPTRSGGWHTWLRGLRWTGGSLAGATAAVLLLGVGWLWMAKDPVAILLEHAVDEHAEYVKDTMTRPAADPAGSNAGAARES